MPAPPIVIAVNYHRVGATDPANPLHQLHTVASDVFAGQLALMRERGRIVSLDQVRAADGLAPVNFVLCFDDIPVSAADAVAPLLEAGLPVVLSVCAGLADHGRGTRDKVYAIEKYADPAAIARHVHGLLPGREHQEFYYLTKASDLDPDWVRDELIDPLFADIEHLAGPRLSERGYLSWDQLRPLLATPLATLANHTLGHDNLNALSRDAVRDEVRRAHTRIAARLGPPRYFTVPYGRLDQRLALDLLDPLLGLGYEGVLWVGAAGTTICGPYRRQLLQLTRLHAATSLEEFTAQVKAAERASVMSAIWTVPLTAHRDPVTVSAGSDPGPLLAVEQVLRQGKDYASDPEFYGYQFTANPAKGERPDYYTATCKGRIEATAYQHHAEFLLDGELVPGVYVASWRRLPHAHPASAARLLTTILAAEPIVGVYDPNPEILRVFADWLPAEARRLTLPATSAVLGPEAPYWHQEYTDYPEEADPVCAASVARAGFTLARGPAYQRWRHGSYPLTRAAFVLLYRGADPAGLAVVLRTAATFTVVDYHLADDTDPGALIAAVLAHAAARGASAVVWETSDQALTALAADRYGATSRTIRNFYHFNPDLLGADRVAALRERWPVLALHETATTGDVLPR